MTLTFHVLTLNFYRISGVMRLDSVRRVGFCNFFSIKKVTETKNNKLQKPNQKKSWWH